MRNFSYSTKCSNSIKLYRVVKNERGVLYNIQIILNLLKLTPWGTVLSMKLAAAPSRNFPPFKHPEGALASLEHTVTVLY
jgi:hypothetical protein